jgi:hypothetical protein
MVRHSYGRVKFSYRSPLVDTHEMNLIQIVPGLLPRFDGIGDYAMQIARRLRENHGIHTSFIVGDPAWVGGEVEGFFATKVGSRSCDALLEAVKRCERTVGADNIPALLHFSPYGYQVRGYPLWLQRTLERWQMQEPNTLNIAFHELDVHCSRPWSSAFWVSPLQRNLIRHIAKTGNFVYTNTAQHLRQLKRLAGRQMALIPNFSTLGEPAIWPPFAKRLRQILVFGRGAQRKANYARGSDVLSSLCRHIGAEKIIDIGEPIDDAKTNIDGIPIVSCGRLEAGEINKWMSTSMASFIAYPLPLLDKSSVFAVSCAHGAVPFIFDHSKAELACPGLLPGQDFITLKYRSSEVVLPRLDLISGRIFNDYQARSSAAAAGKIAMNIFGTGVLKRTTPVAEGCAQQEHAAEVTTSC